MLVFGVAACAACCTLPLTVPLLASGAASGLAMLAGSHAGLGPMSAALAAELALVIAARCVQALRPEAPRENMSRALEQHDAADSAIHGNKTPAAGGEAAALGLGGIAALLVGACCVAPLVLVSIGLGGAWLANLTALNPYRPLFAGIALVCLAFAWWRIYRPRAACEPAGICAVPAIRKGYKIGFWAVAALLILMFAFPYVAPYLL